MVHAHTQQTHTQEAHTYKHTHTRPVRTHKVRTHKVYRVAETHRMPYLYRSFPAKQPYI